MLSRIPPEDALEKARSAAARSVNSVMMRSSQKVAFTAPSQKQSQAANIAGAESQAGSQKLSLSEPAVWTGYNK